jgi:hypothetical protein
MTRRHVLAVAAFGICLAAAAPAENPASKAEIDHLLDYIAHSGCRFNRNGSWHGMDEARDHITMKYESLRKRGRALDAETFIEEAASKSSLSGKDYLVECPGKPVTASRSWLRAELDRFRVAPPKKG